MTGPAVPTTPRPPSAHRRRLAAITRLHHRRYAVQLAVVALIVGIAVRHQSEQGTASVDAVCPFGAVETLWTWATTGAFVTKIHASNLVMGLALAASVLLVGNAFCGWICPFGTVQDTLTWVRRKLRVPDLPVPARWDRVLRHGRFVVLGVIVWMGATTARLWFFDYDPYVTLFGLHWLYEFTVQMWPALAILAGVLAVSVLVERAWCRYLCPLGGVLSVLGHLSLVRVRRSATACTGCDLCVRPCPVGLDPAAPVRSVSPDCIGCLECVAACPSGGALTVSTAAPWRSWGPLPEDSAATRGHRPVSNTLRRKGEDA